RLAFALHRCAVVRAQGRLDPEHRRTVVLASRNAERRDAVAQAIDLLARRRKAVVIGEGHRRISPRGRRACYCTVIAPIGDKHAFHDCGGNATLSTRGNLSCSYSSHTRAGLADSQYSGY